MRSFKQKKSTRGRGVNLSERDSAQCDGTALPTFRENQTLQKELISKKVIFNILNAVMPAEHAKVLAGYSANTNADKLKFVGNERLAVEDIRVRLQETAGVTLADQVAWYVKASGDPEGATSDQINARKRIDSILGYDAAQKVEMNMNSRKEIVMAVGVFREFNKQTGLNPRQLLTALRNRRKEPVEIPAEEVNGDNAD